MDYLLLLFGLALIVKGGDLFVDSASAIATLLRLPRMVVGATIMSLATTSPELAVSVMSGLRGASDLAVGNAVGSHVCNLGLIAGMTAAFRAIVPRRREVLLPCAALAVIGLLMVALSVDGTLGRGDSLALAALGVAYIGMDLRRHLRARDADSAPAPVAAGEISPAWPRTTALFALGAVMVVGGSRLLVEGAVNVATALGVAPLVIGLTVVALGTSLPELVSAIVSLRKGVSDLSVGNILGANILNLTLVVGSAGALAPIALTLEERLENFAALFGFLGVFGFGALVLGRLDRRVGIALLVLYAAYLTAVVATARG